MRLNINGIDTELKFSMLQLERMSELAAELGSKKSSQQAALVASGIEIYYKHAKQDNPFKTEDIVLWVDDLSSTEEGNKLLDEINAALNKSFAFKKLIQDSTVLSDDEKKSILNGRMSEPLLLEK